MPSIQSSICHLCFPIQLQGPPPEPPEVTLRQLAPGSLHRVLFEIILGFGKRGATLGDIWGAFVTRNLSTWTDPFSAKAALLAACVAVPAICRIGPGLYAARCAVPPHEVLQLPPVPEKGEAAAKLVKEIDSAKEKLGEAAPTSSSPTNLPYVLPRPASQAFPKQRALYRNSFKCAAKKCLKTYQVKVYQDIPAGEGVFT
jgi:hypothetical protein